jgi:hypothetical protein
MTATQFIHILQSSQRLGFGSVSMGAMPQELRRRQLHPASLWSLRGRQRSRLLGANRRRNPRKEGRRDPASSSIMDL